MSRTDTAVRTAPITRTTSAEAMLRDMAFVLRMTQKVKADLRPADRIVRPAPRAVAVGC